MRRALALMALVVLAAAGGPAGEADHDPEHAASGNWEMSFQHLAGRADTGQLHLAFTTKAGYDAKAESMTYGKWGSWAAGECGSNATQFYVGTFTRDKDSGPVVGCISGGPSGLFYGVFQSTVYKLEGGLAGTIGGVMESGIFPAQPTDSFNTIFDGHFPGDGTTPLTKVKLGFKVYASGKPNVAGLTSNPKLIRSTLQTYLKSPGDNAYAQAVFVAEPGKTLLRANDTKGKVVEEDFYSDGTSTRVVLGIHSGSVYDPVAHKVALILTVDDSNDPNCPTGAGAGLVIIPGGGVDDTVMFLGLPVPKTLEFGIGIFSISKTVTPCKLRNHGWHPGAGTTARLSLTGT